MKVRAFAVVQRMETSAPADQLILGVEISVLGGATVSGKPFLNLRKHGYSKRKVFLFSNFPLDFCGLSGIDRERPLATVIEGV